MKLAALLLANCTALLCGSAFAEEAEAPTAEAIDHTIIFGLGGAAELELGDGSVRPGGNVMVEWDIIENWLEFEVGASLLTADKGAQVPIDLLVKKPFRLARGVDFMIGIGPEVVRVTGSNKGTFFGGEVALDFMFWPSQFIGFWVEPTYDLVWHDGVSHGLGGTGGVLFGW